jgi:hypothetical protein
MTEDRSFVGLVQFLARIPAIETNTTPSLGIGRGSDADGWWIKFVINLDHPLAWHTVQELGHVLNYLSLEEPLPTTFKPVSPPPYMNGGPRDYLSWIIQCPEGTMSPDDVAQWLEGRLPKPVEDESQWQLDDDD